MINYIKPIAIISIVIAVFYAGYSLGHNKAENAAKAEKIALLNETKTAIKKAEKDYLDKVESLKQINEKTLSDLQIKQKALDEKYRTALASNSVGLRVPTSICRADEAAKADPSRRIDEASTVRLPRQIESDLYALARAGDDLANQLSALQSWVKSSCVD